MTTTPSLPPELLTPEDREARIAWLKHRIAAGWVRFVVLETVLIGLPGVALLIAWVTESISKTTAIVLFVALAGVDGAFTVYWVLRTRRLTHEVEALAAFEAER